LMYGFLYVTDKYEGLIVVGNPDLKGKNPGIGTLLDGNPEIISSAARPRLIPAAYSRARAGLRSREPTHTFYATAGS